MSAVQAPVIPPVPVGPTPPTQTPEAHQPGKRSRPRAQVRRATLAPEPPPPPPPVAATGSEADLPPSLAVGLDPWDERPQGTPGPEVDQAAVDELSASLQGRGPRKIDHTPAVPPRPVPQSIREMWEAHVALEAEVARLATIVGAGGGFGQPKLPVPTLVRCSECPSTANVHRLPWPPDPLKGLLCPVQHTEVSMLTPLTAQEVEAHEAKVRSGDGG